MDNYKKAVFEQTRIQTPKGLLSVEQLCTLTIPELDVLAVSLQEEHTQSARKSFVVKTTAKNKDAKFKFDLVLDILNTKVEMKESAAEAAEIREYNKKIDNLIAGKQDEALSSKSISQLEKMRR